MSVNRDYVTATDKHNIVKVMFAKTQKYAQEYISSKVSTFFFMLAA
jgi:hypothetical protein